MTPLSNPKSEYRKRLSAQTAACKRLERWHNRLASARLAVFLTGVAAVIAVWPFSALHPSWVPIPIAVFIALLIVHVRTLKARRRAEVLVQFYEAGLARLDDQWRGQGVAGLEFLPGGHPSAEDLDLFGEGSLFELMCAARTSVGRETLAGWMTAPAPRAATLARQQAVGELRTRLGLREDLALAGEWFARQVDPACLRTWVNMPPEMADRGRLAAAGVLTVCALLSLLVWTATGVYAVFFLVAALEVGYLGLHRRRLAGIAERVSEPARELHVLARILRRFEAESFESPLLCELRQQLVSGRRPASREIARLDTRVFLFDAQFNQLFIPVAVVTQWGIFCAWALERWRTRHARELPAWLDAVGALEALSSIAGYAYENPEDPFPEICGGAACFTAEGLGHPLLNRDACVRNDVALTRDTPVLLVSGSNMSGKSTLLRTVGVNTVLAHMGAPVRARRLRLTPLAPGATMRVHDSIQEGASGFYAELLRLKRLQEMASGPVPLLFLLDEILHGTNSHDRRVGAEALIRAFAGAGAIGLVTTHDLAVTEMESALEGKARNVHFQDQVVGGELVFDYTLRPGVVGKSNALELMRRVGLRLPHGGASPQTPDAGEHGVSPH